MCLGNPFFIFLFSNMTLCDNRRNNKSPFTNEKLTLLKNKKQYIDSYKNNPTHSSLLDYPQEVTSACIFLFAYYFCSVRDVSESCIFKFISNK